MGLSKPSFLVNYIFHFHSPNMIPHMNKITLLMWVWWRTSSYPYTASHNVLDQNSFFLRYLIYVLIKFLHRWLDDHIKYENKCNLSSLKNSNNTCCLSLHYWHEWMGFLFSFLYFLLSILYTASNQRTDFLLTLLQFSFFLSIRLFTDYFTLQATIELSLILFCFLFYFYL